MISALKLALLHDGRPAWRVAMLARLSPTILTRITSGQRLARPEERAALARVLGVPEPDLFDAPAAEPRAA